MSCQDGPRRGALHSRPNPRPSARVWPCAPPHRPTHPGVCTRGRTRGCHTRACVCARACMCGCVCARAQMPACGLQVALASLKAHPGATSDARARAPRPSGKHRCACVRRGAAHLGRGARRRFAVTGHGKGAAKLHSSVPRSSTSTPRRAPVPRPRGRSSSSSSSPGPGRPRRGSTRCLSPPLLPHRHHVRRTRCARAVQSMGGWRAPTCNGLPWAERKTWVWV